MFVRLLNTSKLEQAGVVGQEVRLSLVQVLDGVLENLPSLRLKLLLGGAEDLLEHVDKLGSKLLNSGVGLLVELEDVVVDRSVLLVVLLEGKDIDNGGKSLSNEFVVGVLGHHTRNCTGNVVGHAHLVDSQERLELLPKKRVHGESLAGVGRVEDNEANGVSSVRLGQRVGVCEAADKSLAKRLSEGSDGLASVLGNLSDGANSGGSVKVLAGAGKSENRLLEDLPELTEVVAESSSQADNDVKSSVNDEPVVLGRTGINFLLLLLVAKILLARVRSGNDKTNDRNHLLEETILGSKKSRTASLEGGSDVAVDVGNDGTI
jgi:hypothetical protein